MIDLIPIYLGVAALLVIFGIIRARVLRMRFRDTLYPFLVGFILVNAMTGWIVRLASR